MTLAIVDDDEDVRLALARLLHCHSHHVSVFASAEEFEAGSGAVDCLIIDVRLPGLSGLELRERLRRKEISTPVVLITGDTSAMVGELYGEIDAPAVTKPFDDATLMAAIEDAIASTVAVPSRHAS